MRKLALAFLTLLLGTAAHAQGTFPGILNPFTTANTWPASQTFSGGMGVGSPGASWPATFLNFMSTVNVVDPFGVGAINSSGRSSDWSAAHSPCCTNILINGALGVHDRTTTGPTGFWTNYWQAEKTNTATDIQNFQLEASFHNLGGTNAIADPFTPNPTGTTENVRLDSGVGTGSGNPVTAALHILNNGGKYNSAIIVGSNSIVSQTVSSSTIFGAFELPATYHMAWYSAANTLAGALSVDGSNIAQVIASGGINLQNSGVVQTNANNNGQSGVSVLQNNTGANAQANWNLISNNGTLKGSALSLAGGGFGAVQWNGSGTLFLDSNNAAGTAGVAIRTGAAPSAALNINPVQHVSYGGAVAPTLTAGCNGAGSSITGTDTNGQINGQTAAATTCTVTFGTAYAVAPFCNVSGQTTPVTSFTPGTGTLVINFASTASAKFNWTCYGA